MKSNLLGVVLIITCFSIAYAQEKILNKTLIRSYNYSEILGVQSAGNTKQVYGTYGTVIISNNSSRQSYGYQGQEYDPILGLSFFPSRVYNSNTIRFETPDPKSQYHSPYLFVGSDPVNYIDKNGEEGKRLVFYEEVHEEGGITSEIGMHENMKALTGDSYFVPIRDLANETPLNIPDWNGETYFLAHMQPNLGSDVELARGTGKINLEDKFLDRENVRFLEAPPGTRFTSSVVADGRSLGHKLRILSESNKTPVKVIATGGCHGSYAAKKIGQGYIGGFEDSGHQLKTIGIREDYQTTLMGEGNTVGAEGLREFRFHYFPKDKKHLICHRYARNKTTGAQRFHSLQAKVKDGKMQPVKYLAGEDYQTYMRAEVPMGHEKFVRTMPFEY